MNAIEKRWAFTDKVLNEYERKFKTDFTDIKGELIDLFKEIDITREEYFSKVTPSIKSKYERKIREWKKNGLYKGYLKFLVENAKNTYQDIIGVLIFGIYLTHIEYQYSLCQEALVKVANDTFAQAKQEHPNPPKNLPRRLTWDDIVVWTTVLTLNLPLDEYLEALSITAYEEANKIFISSVNTGVLDENKLSKTIEKQKNRIISTKDGRYSGVLEIESVQVGNEAYIRPFPNSKALFIAVMDNRTTDMCVSLNGQIFFTKAQNRFTRYATSYGGLHTFTVNGLVMGLNEPPIIDHFHYCRSILQFL